MENGQLVAPSDAQAKNATVRPGIQTFFFESGADKIVLTINFDTKQCSIEYLADDNKNFPAFDDVKFLCEMDLEQVARLREIFKCFDMAAGLIDSVVRPK